MSVTFVTCVYCVRSEGDFDAKDYYQILWINFQRLLNQLPPYVKIIVFSEERRIEDDRIHYVLMKFLDFETCKDYHRRRLPRFRNPKKDTINYLCLMNCKAEMLNIAKSYAETGHLCWIDSGIVKVTEGPVKDRLERLSLLHYPDNGVVIPGCHSNFLAKRDMVNWRFCGGIVIIPCIMTELFYLLNREQDRKSSLATWEVNIWALLEKEVPRIFRWYKGDHDNTIFDVALD